MSHSPVSTHAISHTERRIAMRGKEKNGALSDAEQVERTWRRRAFGPRSEGKIHAK